MIWPNDAFFIRQSALSLITNQFSFFIQNTVAPSEHIFQGDLYLAHVGARAIDPAKSRGGHADVRITPVRMVREIERLEPELDRVILDDPEFFMSCEITLNAPGCDDRIATRC